MTHVRSSWLRPLLVVAASLAFNTSALAQSSTAATTLTNGSCLIFLGGAAAVTLLLYALLSGLHPFLLLVGADNRYSNSKFQVALWFFLLISVYLAVFAIRLRHGLIGAIEIPQNLFLLSGMSAFTYGAAKGITQSKVNDAVANGHTDPKNTAAEPSFLSDLTHSDPAAPVLVPIAIEGVPVALARAIRKLPKLDLGDTQMLMVTLLAVGTYLCSVYVFLGTDLLTPIVRLPNVDNAILSIFGLGHGAYLTKKAVGNVGES